MFVGFHSLSNSSPFYCQSFTFCVLLSVQGGNVAPLLHLVILYKNVQTWIWGFVVLHLSWYWIYTNSDRAGCDTHCCACCCALLCAVLAITHMNQSLEHCLDQYKSRHDEESSLLYYCGISETDRDLFQVEYLEKD